MHVPWPRRVYVVVCKEKSASESTPQCNPSQILLTIRSTMMPGGYQLVEAHFLEMKRLGSNEERQLPKVTEVSEE